MRGNGLTGENAILVDDEIKEQIKFLWRRIQQFRVYPRLEGVGIETDLVKLYDAGAPQILSSIHGPDTRMQFGQMKGLRDIIIGSLFQPDDLIIQRVPGGNDQDIALLVLAADKIQQHNAAAIRQPDIEQDTIILKK